MILTLLSMLGGGVMRLLPEVFAFLNKKEDNKHELAMIDKQFELEKQKSADRLTAITLQGDVDQQLALLSAHQAAMTTQMQRTGIKFVDALNFLVRPLSTYYLLFMYGAFKFGTFMMALKSGADKWETVVAIYTPDDFNMLAAVMAFWFVGRVMDKAAK